MTSEAFNLPALLTHVQANVHTRLYISYVFRNMYFRRSFKPGKVNGGPFIEANSVFNLGMTWPASKRLFSLHEGVYGTVLQVGNISLLSIDKLHFFPIFLYPISTLDFR